MRLTKNDYRNIYIIIIIKTGSIKAFKFIQNMINNDEKFRNDLFYQGREYPIAAKTIDDSKEDDENVKLLPTPIEISLQYNQPLLMQKMLNIDGVKRNMVMMIIKI